MFTFSTFRAHSCEIKFSGFFAFHLAFFLLFERNLIRALNGDENYNGTKRKKFFTLIQLRKRIETQITGEIRSLNDVESSVFFFMHNL